MENQPLNMKVLLGYLNQSEWLYLLNIGNIMQITPLTIHDLYSNQKIDVFNYNGELKFSLGSN